jgi:transcription elongation factor Elf1
MSEEWGSNGDGTWTYPCPLCGIAMTVDSQTDAQRLAIGTMKCDDCRGENEIR